MRWSKFKAVLHGEGYKGTLNMQRSKHQPHAVFLTEGEKNGIDVVFKDFKSWGERTVPRRFCILAVKGVVPSSVQEFAEQYAKPNRKTMQSKVLSGIYVTVSAIREALQNQLDRKPTDEELGYFIDYVSNDIYEWLKDNAKAFMDVLREKK